jgi:hypothetical protein
MTDPQAVTAETTTAVEETLRQFVQDTNFVRMQWAALQAHYPKEWLAVFSGAVVAHGKTFAEVVPVPGHSELAGRTGVCFTGDDDPFVG